MTLASINTSMGRTVGVDSDIGALPEVIVHHIDVRTLAGSELGRGGTRCLSCPVRRHPPRATESPS